MRTSVLTGISATLLAAINLASGLRFHTGNSFSFLAAFAAGLMAVMEWSKFIKQQRQRRASNDKL